MSFCTSRHSTMTVFFSLGLFFWPGGRVGFQSKKGRETQNQVGMALLRQTMNPIAPNKQYNKNYRKFSNKGAPDLCGAPGQKNQILAISQPKTADFHSVKSPWQLGMSPRRIFPCLRALRLYSRIYYNESESNMIDENTTYTAMIQPFHHQG